MDSDIITCSYCCDSVPGVVFTKVYISIGQGVPCCSKCYQLVQDNKTKPHGKVMERFAVLESGYHINRKFDYAHKTAKQKHAILNKYTFAGA